MKRSASIVLICISLIFGFTSCSIQKRRYNRGFYLEGFVNRFPSRQSDPKLFRPTIKTIDSIRPVANNFHNGLRGKLAFSVPEYILKIEGDVINSGARKFQRVRPNFSDSLTKSDSSGCALMILANGDELQIQIDSITSDSVFYSHCNEPDSAISKDIGSVFMIKYADGSKQVFEPQVSQGFSEQNGVDRRYLDFAPRSRSALTFGILSFLFPSLGIVFSILAIIHGMSASRIINENPDTYRGASAASAGVTLGIIFLILSVILLALWLALALALF
ncbi:MAG: DUF4190 domain-containing protein [Bacteroidetes bacterium]|nr:DUF4190 domain-containing protein [Bacteroidota bacterium]